jgi:hypothetical protein
MEERPNPIEFDARSLSCSPAPGKANMKIAREAFKRRDERRYYWSTDCRLRSARL